MLLKLLATLALVSVSYASPLSKPVVQWNPLANSDPYRLPTSVKPLLYTIEVEPDLVNDQFRGTTSIQVSVTEATNNITLHTLLLAITDPMVSLTDSTGAAVAIGPITESPDDHQFYIISVPSGLVAGSTYTLTFTNYLGVLRTDNAGFYIAKYTDDVGVEKKIALTQFEATDARSVFPCFDEPAMKAVFYISIIAPLGYSSVSNSAIESSTILGDGRLRTTFKPTVMMSSYLVAFIVSDFTFTPTLNINRVLAKPAAVSAGRADFALQTGDAILTALGNFFNIPYTLEKMDQAGIPDEYYAAGAMENWGLVTYREMYTLWSDKIKTTPQLQLIGQVISHEFGHQWTGDLVSPTWWTYIWLNEGFATYLEFLGSSIVYPEWDMMAQFAIKNLQWAFGSDSLESTRPMNTDAGSPSEISDLFDNIAYEKSGSVIRMLETFLTTPVFKSGMNKYLTKMQFSAAQPSDLYSSLQDAVTEAGGAILPAPLTVPSILSTWDSNAGYPVVDVERNYATGDVTFSQSRFLLMNSTQDSSVLWFVPITHATNSDNDFLNTNTNFWLTTASQVVNIPAASTDWLVVNKQQRGFYRVNYDVQNWQNIIDYLKTDNYGFIDKGNRAQLLDDSFNLARSGRLNYTVPMSLGTYIVKERDYVPFYSFYTALGFLNVMLAGTPEYSIFQQYIQDGIVNGVLTYLTFDENTGDKHTDKANRMNTLDWLCNSGNAACRQNSLNKLRAWQADPNMAVIPNLQEAVYCGALRIGTGADWDFVLTQYKDATENSVRTRALNSLGCSENVVILSNFLDLATATDGTGLRPVDVRAAFASAYTAGNLGLRVVFDYIEAHYDRLSLLSSFPSILNGFGARLTTVDQLTELTAFAASLTDASLLGGAIANAQNNIAWTTMYNPDIQAWLRTYTSP